MGVSLKSTASFFSQDVFLPWDSLTNAFLTSPTDVFKGRLFRADRFTSIYHRPTRRTYLSFQTPEKIPASRVVKRQGTEEVYLIGETVKKEVLQAKVEYDNLLMSHLVTNPSGGEAEFYKATVSGTGDNLGLVDLTVADPVYVDLELQSQSNIEETIDSVKSRFLLNFSNNVTPEPGDFFKFQGEWYLVYIPYVDGGLHVSRVMKLAPSYTAMTYKSRSGIGGYDPYTGEVSKTTVDRLFSGVIGKTKIASEPEEISNYKDHKEVYVYKNHIGFEPKAGDEIEIASLTYEILEVVDRREDVQWRMEVAR